MIDYLKDAVTLLCLLALLALLFVAGAMVMP
jgi:hypothetical protein